MPRINYRIRFKVLVIVAIFAIGHSTSFAQTKSESEKDDDAEMAIRPGLLYLAHWQEKGGNWSHDRSGKDRQLATGMALMAFLSVGEGPNVGTQFKRTVSNGLDFLTKSVAEDGKIGDSMHAQAIATIALCDAYYLSKDARLKEPATKATKYIVAAQSKNGSWGHVAGKDGDVTSVNWQVQALFAADRAGIEFGKDKVFQRADDFLLSVSSENGAMFGDKEKHVSSTLTADGLWARSLLGTLKPSSPAFAKGVTFLKEFSPEKSNFDLYYYLSATRVTEARGGDDWKKSWRPKMRDLLLALQTNTGESELRGGWPKDKSFIGAMYGPIGTTAFALLTLETVCGYSVKPGTAQVRGKRLSEIQDRSFKR
jgi:hypothetical protein